MSVTPHSSRTNIDANDVAFDIRQTGLLLHPLRTCGYPGGGFSCSCLPCTHRSHSTWSLAYYVTFGLKIPLNAIHKRYYLPISEDLVAQCYAILQRRIQASQQVHKLSQWAAFAILQNCPTHQISQLPLPPKILKLFKEDFFAFLGSLVDRIMLRQTDASIFRPFQFPQYLMRHMNQWLYVDRYHYADETSRINWFYPPQNVEANRNQTQ